MKPTVACQDCFWGRQEITIGKDEKVFRAWLGVWVEPQEDETYFNRCIGGFSDGKERCEDMNTDGCCPFFRPKKQLPEGGLP